MTHSSSIENPSSSKLTSERQSPSKQGGVKLKQHIPKITPEEGAISPQLQSPRSASLGEATRGRTGRGAPEIRLGSATSGADHAAESDEDVELAGLETALLNALKDMQVRLNNGHDVRPPAETALEYGATKAQLNALTTSHKVKYTQSASADRKMVSYLNDIDGVLKVVTLLKNGRSTFLERMFVIKETVAEEDETTKDRYFFKGFGNTIESFDRLSNSRFLVRREGSGADEEASIQAVEPQGTEMETPFRTFLLQGADESELRARRFEFESPDGKLTAQPVNPSALKSTMAWWSDAEGALERGAGPLLGNGMRTAYADFYVRECRVVFFFNTYEVGADGQPINPSDRPAALINQTHRRAGERPLPAERLAGGPMFAEVDGVQGWEVMAPPELAGVKASKLDRNFGDLKKYLGVKANAGPTIIHLELEESAVVAVRFDDRGMRSSVIKPSPSWGQGATKAILSADPELDADFDVVSVRGSNHGVEADESGRPVTEIVACTGEAARLMPMITNSNAFAGPIRAGLRFLTGKFAVGVGESMSIPANVLNTVLAVGVRVAWVVGQNEVAKIYSRSRGMEGVTSSGGGNIGFGQLAGTVVSMVAAQKFMTLILTIGKHVLPRFWQSPESRLATFGALMVAPMFEEFGRLGINMGLQKAIKIPRGTAADFIGVLTASVSKGMVKFMESRLGSPVNHPVAITALTLVTALIYNISRGYTAAYALDELAAEHRGPTTAERITTTVARLIGRVDHFWDPIATLVFDKIGAIDMHGSTQHSQIARDVEYAEVMTCLTFILDDLSVQAKRGQLWVRHTEAAETLIRKLQTTLESTHRKLNSIGLSQNADYLRQVRSELQEIDRAGAFQAMSRSEKQKFLEEEVRAPLHEQIEANKSAARNDPIDPEAMPPARYTEATLTPKVRAERQRAARAAVEGWQHVEPGSVEVAHFQMSRTGADGRSILAGASAGRFFDTPRPMRDGTTWTRDGQDAAHDVTDRMATKGGMHTLGRHAEGENTASVPIPTLGSSASVTARTPVRGTSPSSSHGPSTSPFARTAVSAAAVEALRRKKVDLPPLSPTLAASTQMPTIKYSKESGFFHLLLRFGFTGALKTVRLGKGRTVYEMVMNQLGNTNGDPAKMVRMIDILLVNLAVHHAPKMPGVVKRGVVTLAPYRARTEEEKQEDAVIPEKVMTDDELAVLTEFMSTTWSAAMGTFFGNGISAGATLDQSQLIYLAQATGVNLTKLTDFKQGEVLIMPGAIFKVVYIDPNSGKRAADGAEQDLGQIPFFEYVDTSKLVQDFDEYCDQEDRRQQPLSADRSPAPNRTFDEGQLMVEHRSGNFVKATRRAKEDDWVYDHGTQWFRKYDATTDRGRQVLVYVRDEKSYFLGRRLSDSKRVEIEGPPRRARWAFPFIADEAPAGAKDGAHAAIMSRERVVREGNLETALSNPNHAAFQHLGDYWNTPGATAHLVQEVKTREQADAISQRIQAMDLDSPLADKDVDLIASLLTSMYRKRLQIVRPDKTVETFNRTYDFRDLDKDDQLMATPSKDPLAPEVTILAGQDGFYAQQFGPDGAALQIKRIAGGTAQTGVTLGNLLHVFNHQAFPRSGTHGPRTGSTSLIADARARTAASETLSELHYFVGVDDLRIKEHLIKAAGEALPPRIPISRLPRQLASRRSSAEDLRHERDLAERGRGLGVGPQRRPTGPMTGGLQTPEPVDE